MGLGPRGKKATFQSNVGIAAPTSPRLLGTAVIAELLYTVPLLIAGVVLLIPLLLELRHHK
jgi:hypothetical protein